MPSLPAITPLAATVPLRDAPPPRPQVVVRQRPDGAVTVHVDAPAAAGGGSSTAAVPSVSYTFKPAPVLGSQLDARA